jgi:hypothetical protein
VAPAAVRPVARREAAAEQRPAARAVARCPGRRPYERFEKSLGDADASVRGRFYADNFVDLMGRALPAELAG